LGRGPGKLGQLVLDVVGAEPLWPEGTDPRTVALISGLRERFPELDKPVAYSVADLAEIYAWNEGVAVTPHLIGSVHRAVASLERRGLVRTFHAWSERGSDSKFGGRRRMLFVRRLIAPPFG
jgi:hypothetical protein